MFCFVLLLYLCAHVYAYIYIHVYARTHKNKDVLQMKGQFLKHHVIIRKLTANVVK